MAATAAAQQTVSSCHAHRGELPTSRSRKLDATCLGSSGWFQNSGSHGEADKRPGLIATAKLNDVEPYAYLHDVLERMVDGDP